MATNRRRTDIELEHGRVRAVHDWTARNFLLEEALRRFCAQERAGGVEARTIGFILNQPSDDQVRVLFEMMPDLQASGVFVLGLFRLSRSQKTLDALRARYANHYPQANAVMGLRLMRREPEAPDTEMVILGHACLWTGTRLGRRGARDEAGGFTNSQQAASLAWTVLRLAAARAPAPKAIGGSGVRWSRLPLIGRRNE